MLIEIESTDLNEFTIDGRTIRQQTGFLFFENQKYPEKITFTVDAAHQPGKYEINLEECARVYRGKLQIGRLLLSPAKVAKAV